MSQYTAIRKMWDRYLNRNDVPVKIAADCAEMPVYLGTLLPAVHDLRSKRNVPSPRMNVSTVDFADAVKNCPEQKPVQQELCA